jgi:tripeptide aminopeptidase
MKDIFQFAAEQFALEGEIYYNEPYGDGHIGVTHLVRTTKKNYILQKINRFVFPEPKKLMENIAAFLNQKYGEGTVSLEIRDSYFNMREKIEPCMYIIDRAMDAMKKLGIGPKINPIRGGTDGARLSFMGLPCPNLCTGGENFHGKFEFIPIEDMEKVTQLLVEILMA